MAGEQIGDLKALGERGSMQGGGRGSGHGGKVVNYEA
jgi:hypothetical protein